MFINNLSRIKKKIKITSNLTILKVFQWEQIECEIIRECFDGGFCHGGMLLKYFSNVLKSFFCSDRDKKHGTKDRDRDRDRHDRKDKHRDRDRDRNRRDKRRSRSRDRDRGRGMRKSRSPFRKPHRARSISKSPIR